MRLSRYSAIVAAAWLAVIAGTASAQNNSKEIMAQDPAKLVAILKDPAAAIFAKAKACQRLAVVGTPEAIPALVALLPDEKLNDYARFGLEGIGGPAATEALRAATGQLAGRPLVGAISSLGHMKDAQAVGVLKALFTLSSDPNVAGAAAAALGQIGTSAAAAVLKPHLGGKTPFLRETTDACIACAEALTKSGRTAEAVALYDAIAKADVPRHFKLAAAAGAFRAQPGQAKSLVLEHLRASDKAFFNLGLALARQAAGADVTTALVAELPKLSDDRQASLLRALGDRKDRVPLEVVVATSKSSSAPIREAAIDVLAQLGDASAVGILVDAALSGGEVAQKAKAGLIDLPGKEADAVILDRLAAAGAPQKLALFELAGARHIAAAAPAVREALQAADAETRLAALAALAQLIDVSDFGLLSDRALSAGDNAETKAARDALKVAALRATDPNAAVTKLASLMSDATAENRAFLMDLIRNVSGPKALEIVVAAARSDDMATKDLGTRVLGEWLNPDAAGPLLEIAKSDSDYGVRALRGYIRIARQLQMSDKDRLDMFDIAMATAKRTADKEIALDILTRMTAGGQGRALRLAVAQLGNPELKKAAAGTAVKVAKQMVAKNPKPVVPAMQKVLDAHVEGPFAAEAQRLLEQAKSAGK